MPLLGTDHVEIIVGNAKQASSCERTYLIENIDIVDSLSSEDAIRLESGRKEDIELAQSTFEERIPRIF